MNALDPLLIRADAGERIGTGHVMRMIALAEAYQDRGGAITFACVSCPDALVERMRREGMGFEWIQCEPSDSANDIKQTIALAKSYGAKWIALDGYHFGAEYQREFRETGFCALAVDDFGHAGHYCADLVLNQNLHADKSYYSNREAHTRLLLGPDYVQLRREFRQWMNWKREIPPTARKILVTLGGSDPDNLTAKILNALPGVNKKDLEVIVVVGGGNQHYQSLLALAELLPMQIRFERDTPDMDKWMAWADAAISSGGTTVWELAFMGLPSLVGQIGPAEDKLVGGLERLDLFSRIGWFRDASSKQIAATVTTLLRDADLRNNMSRKARKLIDGRGCDRVVALLQSANNPARGEKN